jgi:hypothetical protein
MRYLIAFLFETVGIVVSLFAIPVMMGLTTRYMNGTLTEEDQILLRKYKEELDEETQFTNIVPIFWILMLMSVQYFYGLTWWLAGITITIAIATMLDYCLQITVKKLQPL